jgi:predicted nucleotidyltransferase
MATHFGAAHLDQLIQEVPRLRLLILFGSRAKNTWSDRSDWDLAIALDPDQPQNWLVLPHTLAGILQIPDDRLDLVDVNHCSPVLG